MGFKKKAVVLLCGLLAVVALFGRDLFTQTWKYRESNPISHGKRVAQTLGCFSCHGPGGMKGIRNPKTDSKTVPEWAGSVGMMYLKGREEIREYVLDGFPKRKRENPELWKKFQEAGYRMPAYRDRVRGKNLEDLLAYVETVLGMEEIGDPDAEAGRDLAAKWGCTQCHGPAGSGGPDNPGSFAGFIPGWLGPAFSDLVRSDDEFREWVRTGSLRRLEENPVSRFFFTRQQIKMAGYEADLTPKEIDRLSAYVRWLRTRYSGPVPR